MAELNTAFQAASAEMYAQSGAQGGAQAGPDMAGQPTDVPGYFSQSRTLLPER